jgi:hypothetical protein
LKNKEEEEEEEEKEEKEEEENKKNKKKKKKDHCKDRCRKINVLLKHITVFLTRLQKNLPSEAVQGLDCLTIKPRDTQNVAKYLTNDMTSYTRILESFIRHLKIFTAFTEQPPDSGNHLYL